MERDAIDRLLDEGLKNYTRVEPAGDFAGQVRAAGLRGHREPAIRRWWFWLPVPLAAAALILLAVALRWPGAGRTTVSVRTAAPAVTSKPAPSITARQAQPRESPRSAAILAAQEHRPRGIAAGGPEKGTARRSVHVLSPEELADVRLPPAFLQPNSSAGNIEIKDLAVPELKVRPIEVEPMEPGGSAQTR